MFSLRLIFQSKTFQERLFYINVKLEIHKGSKNFMGEISKANRSRAISKYQHDKRISDLISRHERFVSVPRKRGIAKVIVRVAGIGWWVTIVRFTDEWKMGEKKGWSRGWISRSAVTPRDRYAPRRFGRNDDFTAIPFRPRRFWLNRGGRINQPRCAIKKPDLLPILPIANEAHRSRISIIVE